MKQASKIRRRPDAHYAGASVSSPRLDNEPLVSDGLSGYQQILRQNCSPEVIKTYRRNFTKFESWCEEKGYAAIPATQSTLARYICELASDLRPLTIRNIISAIAFVHRYNGVPFDRKSIATIWEGILRVHGSATKQANLLEVDYLKQVIDSIPKSKSGLRDRALLLVAFCGAFRPSQLVGLDFKASDPGSQALWRPNTCGAIVELKIPGNGGAVARIVYVHFSRTEKYCPCTAVENWVEAAGISRGPLFVAMGRWENMSGMRISRNSINLILRQRITNFEVSQGVPYKTAIHHAWRYSMKSLRAGFIKRALEAGVNAERIAMHMGHVTFDSLDRFNREHSVVRPHPLSVAPVR